MRSARSESRLGRKILTRALAVLSVILILLLLAGVYILNPRVTEPEHVDAVFVLAFGEERLAKGRDLATSGTTEVVVFSRPTAVRELVSETNDDPKIAGLWFEECAVEYEHYLALCVEPSPETTFGEAKAIGELARQNGWESIAVVTDVYHLGRATSLVESCFSGEVYPVAVYPDYSLRYRAFRTVYEMGAYLKGFFSDQTC